MFGKTKILSVKNLNKTFFARKKSFHVLKEINFDIFEKETVALVGESGSGKTTLAKIILNLIKPSSGDIFFENRSIFKKDKNLKKNIQIVFQDPYLSLNPRMTIAEILKEPIKIHKIVKKDDIQSYINELLHQINLSINIKTRFAHEFSGGQRQRIAIARAIAVKPKFIVLDEPLSSLDVSIQAQIIQLLQNLQKKCGLTYLFISHDLAVVKYISTKVLVMYLGQIVEMADTKKIFTNPKHPYTQTLIKSSPVFGKKQNNPIKDELSFNVTSNSCLFASRCKYAKDICLKKMPNLENIDTDHLSRCHFSKNF